MYKIVLDTSVYIPLLRNGKAPGSILGTSGAMLYLSVVVAEELYAGAGDSHTIGVLDELYGTFEDNDRLLVPATDDWRSCGIVLSQIGRKHGFESIKKGRLVNDVLIALSCRSANAVLITANQKDFSLIHDFVKFQFLGV